MIEILKKEYVIKRKLWNILLGGLLETIALSILFYIAVTDYNKEIVDIFVTISEKNIAYEVTQIMFPIFLIIVFTMKFADYLMNDKRLYEEEKLKYLKRKKTQKKSKNTK